MNVERAKPLIFISYRRDDSSRVTGKIRVHLMAHFGSRAVGQDIHNISPGADFRDSVTHFVSNARILIVVIGKKWVASFAEDRRGGVDHVKLEIETALSKNVHIVPVLVNGAAPPAPGDLPDTIKSIAFRHSITIRSFPNFGADMGSLTKKLNPIVLTSGERAVRGAGEVLGCILGLIIFLAVAAFALSLFFNSVHH